MKLRTVYEPCLYLWMLSSCVSGVRHLGQQIYHKAIGQSLRDFECECLDIKMSRKHQVVFPMCCNCQSNCCPNSRTADISTTNWSISVRFGIWLLRLKFFRKTIVKVSNVFPLSLMCCPNSRTWGKLTPSGGKASKLPPGTAWVNIWLNKTVQALDLRLYV